MASASDPQVRTEAVRQLAGLLFIEHIEGIGQKTVDIGVVPLLVEQLSECEDLQAAAGQALSVLAIQNGDAVVNAGAVPPLVQLLSSPDDDVHGRGIATLCNVTAGSAARRDVVVAAGILEPLLKVMRESSNAAMLTVSAHLLRNLWIVSENAPLPAPLAEFAPFLPLLINLIAAPQQDECVLEPARVALADFAGWCAEKDGTVADRDALVECGAVTSIKTLLEMADDDFTVMGCLIVQFIGEGSTAHFQAIIDADLVPLLVDLAAGEETDPDLKEIAVKIIGNIVRGGLQRQVEHVVECGGIQPLCYLLDGENDNRLTAMLWLLDKILRAGRQKQEGLPDTPYCTLIEQAGGVDKMAALQTHNDMGVALQAIVCLISHFPTRVDAQRLEALMQAGVIQVVQADEVETNVGEDDDIGSDGDSDGGGEGKGVGQLEGDSGGERAEG
ncbi:unnamed protein product [Vitrella brassicaformis CCMP3155]|uniref:Importin subunit alpha n=1 Tax=Vitrella brassicaformis (strain CCMP3155) TaxID=1169540 RepID=A0A0G4FBN5_VITBC|nr:unnamed protein product [Vitrella brassicaformis CCMP3155]|eukprot:CEM10029.1 unnamed protein product [Vitrella brassicaformis CCMP3155]